MLKIQSLTVTLTNSEKTILENITATLNPGEVTYLLGPNGSGKSSLLHTLMGSPFLEVTGGDIALDGDSLIGVEPNERAKKGLFLSFQEPPGIPGVKVIEYLYNVYSAIQNKPIDTNEFHELAVSKLKTLKLAPEILNKELNVEFSGGEKKRLEILAMLLLEPKYVLLDELDSGLDVDAVELLFSVIKDYFTEQQPALVIVSHHFRVAKIIPPHQVLVLKFGQLEKSGGPELLEEIEEKGFYK